MSQPVPPAPLAFRAAALRLVRSSRKPHAPLARELGLTPDLVQRTWTASAPDRWGGAASTAGPTWERCLALAVIRDACRRRIVGWAHGRMGAQWPTELVLAGPGWSWGRWLVLGALALAPCQRHPAPGRRHHADPGCQDHRAAVPPPLAARRHPVLAGGSGRAVAPG
jgi:hypothetical protein